MGSGDFIVPFLTVLKYVGHMLAMLQACMAR